MPLCRISLKSKRLKCTQSVCHTISYRVAQDSHRPKPRSTRLSVRSTYVPRASLKRETLDSTRPCVTDCNISLTCMNDAVRDRLSNKCDNAGSIIMPPVFYTLAYERVPVPYRHVHSEIQTFTLWRKSARGVSLYGALSRTAWKLMDHLRRLNGVRPITRVITV